VKKSIRAVWIEGNIAFVPLTQGFQAIIDKDDVGLVSNHNWCVLQTKKSIYACRKANGTTVFLHRVILDAPSGHSVDHIDGDGLNNRRANLRLATRAENNRNRKIGSDNSSGLKGVSFHKHAKKWQAQIRIEGKQVHLGYFREPAEAHKAYSEASLKHHGDFGRVI